VSGEPRQRIPLVAAELGLLALALGTVLTFTRLFQGTAFVASLAVPLVTSWLTAVVLRRLGLGPGWSTLASAVLGVAVLTWWFVPGTTWFGLPTGRTVEAVADAVATSFGGFSEQVAPVPATDGFVVTIAALLWLFVLFADTSALRYRAPVQAVLPYAAMVVASGILARDAGRVGATVAFVAGLAVYAVTQRVWQASEEPWRPGDAPAGVRALAGSTSAIAVGVLALGVLVAPFLPGDQEAVVDLRSLGRGEGPRTVVSPFVGVTSLLGERSDEVVFTVTSPAASYWRLTALEQYDPSRSIWTSRGTYRSTDGALAAPVDGATALDQSYELAGLGGLWLPAAFEATAVETDIPVGFDESSSSIIARDDANVPGTTYRVRSIRRDVRVGAVTGDSEAPVPGIDEVSPAAARTAGLVVGDEPDPFRRALLLQDWLRGPGAIYDTAVDYRGAEDPVAAFLAERRGFCQQFASAFALMARSLGLPSRVAVGFTPGDQDPDRPDRFVVRGRHAHAWPEVELPGLGWVAFEPTPGRGDPTTTGYTGVAAAQASPPPEQSAGSTSTSTTSTVPSSGPTTVPTFDASGETPERPDGVAAAEDGSADRTRLLLGLVAVALVAVGAESIRRWRRSRRRTRDLTDPRLGPVAVAWSRASDALRILGHPARPEETPLEFADRIGRTDGLGDVAADLLTLARIETYRRYGRSALSEDSVELAGQLADHVHAAALERLDRRRRIVERIR